MSPGKVSGLLWSLIWLCFAGLVASPAAAQIAIDILYLEHQQERPPTLSNLDAPPADEGVQGARLGIEDNRTTGKFLKHGYTTLREVIVAPGGDFVAAARAALAAKSAPFIVVNAPADDLLALADLPQAKKALIFNAGAPDTRLRNADCRANVLHTLPSRAMLADALLQYLTKKRWTDILLIEGARAEDKLFGQAIRNAAKEIPGDDWRAKDLGVRRGYAPQCCRRSPCLHARCRI